MFHYKTPFSVVIFNRDLYRAKNKTISKFMLKMSKPYHFVLWFLYREPYRNQIGPVYRFSASKNSTISTF